MSPPGHTRVAAPIHDLPLVAAGMIERAAGSAPGRLALTYLRVKPGRGLVAVYRVVPTRYDRAAHPPLICLSVGEAGIHRTRDLADWGHTEDVEGTWPGTLRWPEADLTLQSFPTDRRLPALAAACDISPGSPTAAALAAAASDLHGVAGLRLREGSVEPLRYKPGDRCVVRYRLMLQSRAGPRPTTLIGKVYREPGVATRVHGVLKRMHAAQLSEVGSVVRNIRLDSPFVPRPVQLVEHLGLTLSEDVRRPGVEVVSGAEALGRHGSGDAIPHERLAAAAVTLARLHLGSVPGGLELVRTGEAESARAQARAQRLGDVAPNMADRARSAADTLERLLSRAPETPLHSAHGSFKSAQLLFRGADEVLVTDFDQLCRAEPALDVGYFLAYLRPPSLWYRRTGAREWFNRSARVFADAYSDAAVELGADPSAVDETLLRSPLYEAALLFKIANRRPNRLNSLRSRELEAMLDEVESCLKVRQT